MRTYVILNEDEVEDIDFGEVMETSADTLRFSVDGDKTFVKFEGDTPTFLEGEDTYTHSEILAILQTEEWSDFPDPPE
tara:strand:- start:1369 stop:1602 length:234 start_codon:yes stop_codon:yes gene_type:complete